MKAENRSDSGMRQVRRATSHKTPVGHSLSCRQGDGRVGEPSRVVGPSPR